MSVIENVNAGVAKRKEKKAAPFWESAAAYRYGFVALKTTAPARKRGGRAPLKPVVLADGLDFRLSFERG